MMNLRWNVLGASLVISASALGAALPIAVRFDCPTTTNSPSPARMALERALDRHPGLVDEVWMTCGRDLDRDAHRRAIKASEEWRRGLEKRGVAVSCQVLTLGHDAWDYEGFAEEDFAVDIDGKRVGRTIFCATSPAVREANRRLAETVMAELKPVSFWPDDDLRLSKRRNRICFCDRCLALFNGETGRHETRASLKAGLYGKPGDAALRRDWTAFNGRVLARFAALYREAADKAHPACRIGLQTVQAYARYNGASFAPLLEAMSGDGRSPVDIRPGAGYYTDARPWGMFKKALGVMMESTRFHRLPFAGRSLYESENWPRTAVLKNPGSQMLECALALAAGCDGLTLYYASDASRENAGIYDFHYETLAKWKPFLQTVKTVFADTLPVGISPFCAGEELTGESWCSRWNDSFFEPLRNALPLVCEEGVVEAHWIDVGNVQELSDGEIAKLAGKPVLVGESAAETLLARAGAAKNLELIRFSDAPAARALTGIRREELLDRVDAAVPGGQHVRLLTGGFATPIFARVTPDGRTAGAFIVNAAPGETMPLKLALRNPRTRSWRVVAPGVSRPLQRLSSNDREVVLQLPPMEGWTCALVAPDEDRAAAGVATDGGIVSGALWRDTNGHVVNAHGGGVIHQDGRYWWYGEHKVYGRAGNWSHVGIHAYSSVDLVSWEDRGIVLDVSDDPEHPLADNCIMERPKVVRVPKTGKFVMYLHLEKHNRKARLASAAIAVADRPEGPFAFVRHERPHGADCRDMNLFADDDGSLWHIFSSERNMVTHLVRLTDDGLGYTDEEYRLFVNDKTEAQALFKANGQYWCLGSGCSGWKPNEARLYRAERLQGPWVRLENPLRGINPQNGLGPDLTWGGQSTCVFRVAGTNRFIAMFDLWKPENQADSRYLWQEIVFTEEGIVIPWSDAWCPFGSKEVMRK